MYNTTVISSRFRGFLPVVVDVETAGFNAKRDALLEVAAVILDVNSEGLWHRHSTHACHIIPFDGANLDKAALDLLALILIIRFVWRFQNKRLCKAFLSRFAKRLNATNVRGRCWWDIILPLIWAF